MTKKKHFILLLNKMCMNLKNSHPFTESAEGISVHNHHAVFEVLVTAQHRFTYLTGFLPRGPGDLRCGAYFRWKNLGGFVSQISKRNIFKEQVSSSGSLECGSQLRNQSIPFYWKKKFVIRLFQLYWMPYLLKQKELSYWVHFHHGRSCICTNMKFVYRCSGS